MAGKVSQLDHHIGYWMRMVSNRISQAFAVRLAEKGVTVAEWVLLRSLYEHRSVNPHKLAEEMGMTRGAISKLVERLVDKGLIARTEEPGDRRYQNLSLPSDRRPLIEELAALADENDDEFFNCLTEAERNDLKQMLIRLAQSNGIRRPPTK